MREWLRQAAVGLPRTFWLLWTGSLINRLGSFVIIFLAIYLTGERFQPERGRPGDRRLCGFVQEHLGDATSWLGCFAVCALVAAGQWLSGPSRDRRIARLRTAEAMLTPDEVAEPELSPAPTDARRATAGPEKDGAAPERTHSL